MIENFLTSKNFKVDSGKNVSLSGLVLNGSFSREDGIKINYNLYDNPEENTKQRCKMFISIYDSQKRIGNFSGILEPNKASFDKNIGHELENYIQ